MRNILVLLFMCNLTLLHSQNKYKIIYEADKDGKTIAGDREQLVNFVENGNPVRVGWVLKFKNPKTGNVVEMQHWSDAGFVTILEGHVFAQIQSIYQQGPSISKPPAVFLVNDKPNGWVAIIGSTGVMRQKYVRDEEMMKMMLKNGMSEEELEKQLKEMETMSVPTKWAVVSD